MNKRINLLRKKFKKHNIDGYIVSKNDDYFTEYSKINRLEIISNFTGSAGLAIILKNKNYLFTDGRYTCLLYTSPSPRDSDSSRMPSSA